MGDRHGAYNRESGCLRLGTTLYPAAFQGSFPGEGHNRSLIRRPKQPDPIPAPLTGRPTATGAPGEDLERPSNQRFCDINPPSFPVITTAHSLPCLLRLWLNDIHGTPPPPGRSSRPPPAPSRGGGQCMAIARIAVHGGRKQDLREYQVRPRSSGLLPWHCVYGRIAPVGEGLTGRGEADTAPPPLSRRVTEDVFSMRAVDHPRLPALPAPPPAPSRGRAVGGDSPGYGARGAGTGFR